MAVARALSPAVQRAVCSVRVALLAGVATLALVSCSSSTNGTPFVTESGGSGGGVAPGGGTGGLPTPTTGTLTVPSASAPSLSLPAGGGGANPAFCTALRAVPAALSGSGSVQQKDGRLADAYAKLEQSAPPQLHNDFEVVIGFLRSIASGSPDPSKAKGYVTAIENISRYGSQACI